MGKKSKSVERCCNPFKYESHKSFYAVLDVTQTLMRKARKISKILKSDQKICKDCKKEIENRVKKVKRQEKAVTSPKSSKQQEQPEEEKMEVDDEDSETSSDAGEKTDPDEGFEPKEIDAVELKKKTNEILKLLEMQPIDDTKIRGKKYQNFIVKKFLTRITSVLFAKAKPTYDGEKIIEQLKEKFDETESRDMKIKILSVFPKDWSFSKYEEVFGKSISYRIVHQTKTLVKKNGILCGTNKKIGSKSIDQNTIDKVIAFYRNDHISRSCPGIREYKRYKSNGEYDSLQRRLILMNLKEAFEVFKSDNPGCIIGFSKFASLRPKECVLANSTHGIHTTCVCVYHQNVKLIFDSMKNQFNLREFNIENYRDLMDLLLCKEISDECRLNQCLKCPGIDGIREDREESLRDLFFGIIDEDMIGTISFKQWVNAGSKYFYFVLN